MPLKIINNFTISELITDFKKGKLRIPPFQRKYVWERSKVIKLFDSIYNEFPIGSIFIWKTDNKYSHLFRDIPELDLPRAERAREIDLILDGQQRTVSLYAAIFGLKLWGTDYSKICFDLENEKFLKIDKRHKGENLIPITNFLKDEDDFLNIYDTLNNNNKKKLHKCRSIFNSYPISKVEVSGKDLTEAIRIFERINQGGKKLSIFDLVAAGTYDKDFDLREEYKKLENDIKKKGFGKISPEIVLHTSSLIIKNYCRKQYLLKLKKEEMLENWEGIKESIKKAVDYLSANLGVKIIDFVPYPAMISLLGYLFFKLDSHSLEDNEMKNKVNNWFWKAAISERYAKSRDTAMEEDRRKFFDKILEAKTVEIKYPININIEKLKGIKISTKSAIRNAFFCILAKNEPRHFMNGSFIKLDQNICSEYNSNEKHHIFPKSYLKRNGIRGKNLMLNFCFIPSELNNNIKSKPPYEYLNSYKENNNNFEEILNSHLIPENALEVNDYEQFLEERANMVIDKFEKLSGSNINRDIDVDENKEIDKIEKRLRKLIDSKLEKDNKNYWKHLPGDIKEKVDSKILEILKRNPDKNEKNITNMDRLKNCDIMDYYKIIITKWNIFENLFKSKFELEKKFINYKNYRNDIKHNKDLDSVVKKEGEAALEWFDRALISKIKND